MISGVGSGASSAYSTAGVSSSVATATGEANQHLVDEFETLSGETLDLASLQGEDVVLWFWAPW